ncbi:MAG: DNA cytosine methyltransferase [Chitinophagaceae bacterium]
MPRRKPSIISLFSGALGLDLGLEKAGFDVTVAVESNKHAAETIRINRPNISVIENDIREVSTKEILDAAKLKVGEAMIVSAGPSCQTFSTAGSRKSFTDPRGFLFHEFLRVVREARPRFFVMENVPGMLSAAIRHRPLIQRGHGYPKLHPNEELGSAFGLILKELKRTGYYITFDVLNAADYGVPQTRERVVFIGSRDGEAITIPEATHSSDKNVGKKKWVSLATALKGLNDKNPELVQLPPKSKKYLQEVPEGGNWRDIPATKRWRAMGKAYNSWGGRVGFFRRLSWDRPSPSLTTSPVSKATMLCHPTELRPLTIKEYMAIQQFPKRWKLAGGTSQKYMQVGNAVPIGLGSAVGFAIKKAMGIKKRTTLRGVVCENTTLLEKLQARPRTMLNPARMRKVKSPKLASEWLSHRPRRKHIYLKHLIVNPKTKSKKSAASADKIAA